MDDAMTLETFLQEWHSPSPTLLVHTSGSTGAPKPMWVEKERMLASARITCNFLNLHAGDTALLCMPLDYIAGKMMVVRSIERHLKLFSVKPSNHPLAELQTDNVQPLNVQPTDVQPTDVQPTDVQPTDVQPTEGIDFAAMVPSQVYCSLQVAEERKRLLGIRHLIIGGGAISQELEEQLKLFPNNVWSTYGMTETLSHIAMRKINGSDASLWYTPFEGVSISTNKEGCLIIDAPNVHEGPLVTNDIAEINEKGLFRILGRKDNIICSGGIKLQIEEIERKLSPYIHQPFCITKRPDPKFGEIVVLLIEGNLKDPPLPSLPREGVEPTLTPLPKGEEVQGIQTTIGWEVSSALSKYEIPKEIIYVDSIPLTKTGKINRKAAEEKALGNPRNT